MPFVNPAKPDDRGIVEAACGWSVRGDTIDVSMCRGRFGKCPPFLKNCLVLLVLEQAIDNSPAFSHDRAVWMILL